MFEERTSSAFSLQLMKIAKNILAKFCTLLNMRPEVLRSSIFSKIWDTIFVQMVYLSLRILYIVNEFIKFGHLGKHFVAAEKTDELKFINCSYIVSKIIFVL